MNTHTVARALAATLALASLAALGLLHGCGSSSVNTASRTLESGSPPGRPFPLESPATVAQRDGFAANDPAALVRHAETAGESVNPFAGDEAPPAFSLKPGQELWIIERAQPRSHWPLRSERDDFPGSGALMTEWKDQPDLAPRTVPVPLAHTGVHASITGPISSVTVTQQFRNPFNSKIEAVYVFPLPDDAAVNDFVMTIGPRSIRGVIREREEARRLYDAAKARGHHAALMSQERSNIFTQRIANIEPAQRIDVAITYFHTLGFAERGGGGYEFVFPMVVGPRYHAPDNPNGIGASPAYAAPTGQPTDVQYLRPGERGGRDISVTVDIDAAVPIESVESPTHRVVVGADPAASSTARVALVPDDSIPNRDFVLRFRLSGRSVKSGVLTSRTRLGDFFCMTIVPPDDLRYTQRGPVEMIFVIDCSGSMEGEPLRLAKRAVVNALQQLRPTDTFQVIRFSDTSTSMSARPIPADAYNLRLGTDHVNALAAGGGTVMLKGLESALEHRGDWSRTRFVCLLSDGLLDNEPEILKQLDRRLGDSRIFSVGIGSAPNRTLLNAMARIGRGAAAYIANDRDADQVMGLFIDRVSSAAMTDLRIDWGDLDVSEVYPKRIPDLFVGRPVVLYGKFRNRSTRAVHEVEVTGRVGDRRETMSVAFNAAGEREAAVGAPAPALPLVWARQKITELDEYAGWGNRPGAGSAQGPSRREIREIAMNYGLVSAYTSFIAIDSSERTRGDFGTTVHVPENVPRGVRYETTVGEP